MKKRILFICGLTAVEGGLALSKTAEGGLALSKTAEGGLALSRESAADKFGGALCVCRGEVYADETIVRLLYSLKLFHEKLEARAKSLEDKELAERVRQKLTKHVSELKDCSTKAAVSALTEALALPLDEDTIKALKEHVSQLKLYDFSMRFKELEGTDLNAADEKSLPGVGALKVALDSAEKASLEDLQSAVNRLLVISRAAQRTVLKQDNASPAPQGLPSLELATQSLYDEPALFEAMSLIETELSGGARPGEAVNSPTPAGPLYWALIFAHYHQDSSGLEISKCMAAILEHYNSWRSETESLSYLSRATDKRSARRISQNLWSSSIAYLSNVGKFDEITDQPTASRRFAPRPTRNKRKVRAAAAGQKLRSGRPRQNMRRLHRGRNSKQAAKQTRRQ